MLLYLKQMLTNSALNFSNLQCQSFLFSWGAYFSWLALSECQILGNGGLLFPLMQSKVTPFCLNDYVPYCCIEDIMQALSLINHPYPPYADQFYDVWQMID